MYPSIDLENNIAPNTQIGRIVIPDQVYDHENFYNNPKYQRGGEFVENMVTDNIIEFCHRWFHFASFMELLQDIQQYYQGKHFGSGNYMGIYYYNTTEMKPICVPIKYTEMIEPVRFETRDVIRPVFFVNPREKGAKYA